MYNTVFNDTLTEVSRRFDEFIYEAFEKHGLSKNEVKTIARENPERIQCSEMGNPHNVIRTIGWHLDGKLIFTTIDRVKPITTDESGCVMKYEAMFSVEHVY